MLKKGERERNLGGPPPVNLTSRGKRKAQIEEDDLALLNDVCRNIFFNRSGKRCGAGHGGARWGPLRGGTRWSALGNAAGRDTMDHAVGKSEGKVRKML